MSSYFLYESWLEVSRRCADERALTDITTGKSWTFRELQKEGETNARSRRTVAFPTGSAPEFILELLRAWRAGIVTCPLEAGQNEISFPAVPENCAHLKITSGTSGAQKAVAFTGPQLAADAANIVSTMGLIAAAPNLACISLAHSYGFSNLVLPLLLHGIPLVLVPAPLPELILKAARGADSITIPAVPALWKTWLQSNAIPSNIHVAISAGAPLPLELESEAFKEAGLKIHNFYGSTECGGIAYDRSSTPRPEANYVGTALDNVRLSASDTGTLVVEGTAVGEGYWPEPQATLRPGRFETADLAEIRDGRVYLQGRVSDLLNIAGRKVSPETIEAVLRIHPAVLECVVFGIPEAKVERSETIVAALNTKVPLQISELSSFLSQKLPTWQIPRRWWFTTELAPNSRGKTSRTEWKRRYIEAHAF